MTEYVCESCGVKTTLRRYLEDSTDDLPLTDECPNCGEVEQFHYL